MAKIRTTTQAHNVTSTDNDALSSYVVEAVKACLGQAYLVGGSVRDALMQRPLKGDLDFATPLQPKDIVRKLRKEGFPADDHAAQFGTIATKINGQQIEITTFRTETYTTGSRSPEVAFHANLQDDLSRRDFTINAIAFDGTDYIDPFGGIDDIRDKQIRTPRDPYQTFEDDPLRMLRAIRFVSTLGFDIGTDCLEAIHYNANLLQDISRERKTDEFLKLIQGEHWVQALFVGFTSQLLDRLFDVQDHIFDIETFRTSLVEKTQDETLSDTQKIAQVILLLAATITNAQTGDREYERSLRFTILSALLRSLRLEKHSEATLREIIIRTSQDEELQRLEADYQQISDKDSYAAMVLMEKITLNKVRDFFGEGDIAKTSKEALKLLEVQNAQLQAIVDTELRLEAIRRKKPYMLLTLEYVLLSDIDQVGMIDSPTKLNQTISKLSKNPAFRSTLFRIGTQEKARAIEKALLMLSRLRPGHYTSLSEAEIMEHNQAIEPDTARLAEILSKYKRELHLIQYPASTKDVIKAKIQINRKIARLLRKKDGRKTSEYYSYVVEAKKYKALLASNEAAFETAYDDLQTYMDLRLSTVDTDIKRATIERGYYLDEAEVLLHLVNLQQDVAEKSKTLTAVLGNYRHAGSNDHHIPRYRIFALWLKIVLLAQSSPTNDDLRSLFDVLRKSTVPTYVDGDEAYLKEYYPELYQNRTNIREVLGMLSLLYDDAIDTRTTFSDKTFAAAAYLFRQNMISHEALAQMLVQRILQLYDPQQSIVPLGSLAQHEQDDKTKKLLQLLKDHESKNVEFKSSWRYDVRTQEVNKANQIVDGILKTVVGFMNCDGGTILIGVDDSGTPIGLEETDFKLTPKKDNQQKKDALKRHIDETLIKRIGQANAQKITIDFVPYSGTSTVASIEVSRSESSPVFLDDIKFFVRHNGSTRELSGIDLATYIKERFYSH